MQPTAENILKKTAAGLYTLTESLKEYNKLGPTVYSNYKPIKIDKWKKEYSKEKWN